MNHRLSVGDTAPTFTLPDARGGDVTLDPSSAPATVVVFTANGCPYALAWHDRIQQVARDYAGRQVAVVQVVSNDETGHPEDSLASMRLRVENGEIAGPYLRDADQEAVAAYGATATPEVFVLDRPGVVRYHGAPDADHDNPGRRTRSGSATPWTTSSPVTTVRQAVRRPRRAARPSGGWSCCGGRAALPHERAAELLSSTLAELHRGDVAVVRREVTTDGRSHPAELRWLPDLPGRTAGPVPGRRRAGLDLPHIPRPRRPGLAVARPRGARRPAPRGPRPPLGPARVGRPP